MDKPLTATEVLERQREYWKEHPPRYDAYDTLADMILEILVQKGFLDKK